MSGPAQRVQAPSKPIRFLASLGTKDEVELIEPSIHHLRRIGVELIIVTDYGSTDGTLAIIEAEERRGDIWLFHVSDDADPLRSEREIALARATAAEWVLFLDTDEFWIPAGGSLDSIAALASHDLLIVDPFDVALTHEVEQHWETYLDHDRLTEVPVFREGAEQWPKVLVRPEALDSLQDGNHAVSLNAERPWRQGRATDVAVAHLPFTTLSRFERKLENIRRFHARDPDWFANGRGAHWLAWLKGSDHDGVEGVFARELLGEHQLRELEANGTLTTIRRVMENRGHSSS